MTIYAKSALTPTGWKDGVSIEIGNDGSIEKVEQRDKPRAGQTSVGHVIASPVNSHSHAFQRAMAGLTEQRGAGQIDSFWTWRRLMYKFIDRLTPEQVEAVASFVQMEMLEAGYATNVEFHYVHHQVGGQPYDNIAELSDRISAAALTSGIGLTLLPVHYQYGGCDKRELTDGQRRFGNDLDRFQKLVEAASKGINALPRDCNIGVAPHSLRAVAPEAFEPLSKMVSDGPVHLHIAEQIPEVEEVQNAWGKRPVEWALDNIDIDSRWCLIHCTQMLPHETKGLAETGAVAGLCPITESSLGDGIFDGMNWMNHGGLISVGSDSNIRISLSEELRTLDYSQRLRDHTRAAFATETKSTGRRLLDAISKGGAQAAARNTGSIEVGKWADLTALDANNSNFVGRSGDTLLDSFVFAADDRAVTDVWSAGRHMVQSGQHIRRDEIARGYVAALEAIQTDL
ncbi:formimidoylglutamate deiminase [Rhodobacteraceae bacterium nBUS_24]